MALLDLPDARQEDAHSCGPAVVRCLLKFHHVAGATPPACPLDGLDPRTLETHLRERVGLSVTAGQMTLDDVAHLCDHARPPILLVSWPGDGCSHYVMGRGVSRGRIYLHDPDVGRRSLPVAEFLPLWTAADGRLSRPLRRWGIAAWPG
jgi:ABC-type bacteriocin/lantibiotic exporter with double-glycine peptidase domain